MRSEGLLSRVDAAVELQQAANQVLVRLLGARYTLGGSPAGQADRNCLWALIEYSLKWRQPLYILLPFGGAQVWQGTWRGCRMTQGCLMSHVFRNSASIC